MNNDGLDLAVLQVVHKLAVAVALGIRSRALVAVDLDPGQLGLGLVGHALQLAVEVLIGG